MKRCTYCESIQHIKDMAQNILKTKDICLIAIDGNSGAGKSTLSEKLSTTLNASIIHMDDFFLPPSKRSPERLKDPGGNVDYERFYDEVIKGIFSKKDFDYNVFSCSDGKYSKKIVQYNPIYIIEGVYSTHPLWFDKIDLSVFMSIGKDKQIERILRRSGPNKLKDYINKWIPLENKYFDTYSINQKCNIIVNS